MRLRERLTTAGSVVLVLFAVLACGKPKAGAKCKKEGEVSCVDKANALLCAGGTWQPQQCRGIVGCITGACNNQGYEDGDPCANESDGNYECSVDKKAMLKCVGNKWAKQEDCKGHLGCVANASGAKCDKGVGAEGDDCTPENEGNASCSEDKKKMFICKGGKMTVGSLCKGMHGCRQMGTKIQCDSSLADVGDVCEDGHSDPACSMDKKALLECKGGKMAVSKKCGRCTVFLDKIDCK
jgi:hypothetical protein